MKSINADDMPRWAQHLRVVPIAPDSWIAGGCMQSLLAGYKVKDIDIFSMNPAAAISWYKEKLGEPVFENDFIADFKWKNTKIQIIKKYTFLTPKETIEAFDFTIIAAAFDGYTLFWHDDFYEHSATKALVIQNLPRPLSTFNRVLKYASRGYTMCPVNRAKLLRTINEKQIDWSNPDENEIEFYPDGTPRFQGLD